MSTPTTEASPKSDRPMMMAQAPEAATTWSTIYRLGGIAALLSIGCIVVAIAVFIVNPPPSTVTEWFELFHRSGWLGVLDLDLMMLVSYALIGVIYLALYGALRHSNEPLMLLAVVCGYVSIATYFASNPAFNMLSLSNQYAVAATSVERAQLLAAGQATLAMWQGSAFVVSYFLAAVATLIIAGVMLRSPRFGKATAYVGLLLGVLTLVPASAGMVGVVFSFAALVSTVVWLFLLARGFFHFSDMRWRPLAGDEDTQNDARA